MEVAWLDYLISLLHTATVLCLMLIGIKKIAAGNRHMTLAFFCFGSISFLMSDIYWIAYYFINPGIRMPFAANEFGEGAMFLLLAASLKVVSQQERPDIAVSEKAPAVKEAAATAVFAAVSTLLWNGRCDGNRSYHGRRGKRKCGGSGSCSCDRER